MAADEPSEQQSLRSGTITGVQAQKKDPNRVSVFIDGAFAFGLASDIAVRSGLRKGMVLSEDQQHELLDQEQQARARIAALDYIAHRARTEQEVRRKLRQKGFSETATEEAISRMLELGYLDDEGYARAFVSSRLASRGHGPLRIKVDLQRRGVREAMIDAALAAHVDREHLHQAALEHARTRWLRLATEADVRKRRRKTMDFLLRRGYDFELIRSVMETVEGEG